MTASLCPFVDDTVHEAAAIAAELHKQGFPYEIQPAMPDTTTDKTLNFIMAAKPKAAILDYFLIARPHVKAEHLAVRLIRGGVPTVLVTKDRSIADEGDRHIQGLTVPLFFKRALISDAPTIARFSACLGVRIPQLGVPDLEEFGKRLSALQDRAFLGPLTPEETAELDLLMARLRLAEREEVGRVETAQVDISRNFSALLETMKKLREDIDQELRQKPD